MPKIAQTTNMSTNVSYNPTPVKIALGDGKFIDTRPDPESKTHFVECDLCSQRLNMGPKGARRPFIATEIRIHVMKRLFATNKRQLEEGSRYASYLISYLCYAKCLYHRLQMTWALMLIQRTLRLLTKL